MTWKRPSDLSHWLTASPLLLSFHSGIVFRRLNLYYYIETCGFFKQIATFKYHKHNWSWILFSWVNLRPIYAAAEYIKVFCHFHYFCNQNKLSNPPCSCSEDEHGEIVAAAGCFAAAGAITGAVLTSPPPSRLNQRRQHANNSAEMRFKSPFDLFRSRDGAVVASGNKDCVCPPPFTRRFWPWRSLEGKWHRDASAASCRVKMRC